MKELCSYGCGQEAIKQFKNGRWCCSRKVEMCQVKRNSLKKLENKGRFKKENVPWNKDKTGVYTKETLSKIGESSSKRIWSEESRKKQKEKMIGKNKGRKLEPHTEKWKREHGEKMKGERNPSKRKEVSEKISKKIKEKRKDPDSSYNSKEYREKQSKFMKNGGAVHANSFNINPSEPQVRTWKITSLICPYVYLNFPITHLENDYSIDIAIPKLSIAIEYDGSYWHQNEEKDLKRQKELEEDGWKFIRYKDVVPTEEQVKEDVNKILNGE